MQKPGVKQIALLFICFLIGFVVIELQRLILPEIVRWFTTPIIILIAMAIFFALVEPEKPFALANTTALIMAVLLVLMTVIIHVVVLKDLGQQGKIGKVVYVDAAGLVSPYVVALAVAFTKRNKKN
jgi:hypothetical protein